jgi:hypothetical protein
MENWFYENDIFVLEEKSQYEGFVYLIENKLNGKKYVGKKNFWFRRKNKKTGRREKKESDWLDYYGSSETLLEDVKLYGKENFKRTILYLCFYQKQMSFYEQKEQWCRNVLLDENYYNTNIGGKFFVREKHIFEKTTKEITTKNDNWRKIKSDNMKGDKNIAKRQDVREKLSEKKKGINHHQFNKPISEEHKLKLHTAAMNSLVCNWLITFPNGDKRTISNMLKFCRENNLSPSAMTQVSKGKRNHHKNFKCVKIS